MAVDRLLPTAEGAELVELVREIAEAELAPRAAADETAGRFPRDVFDTLGTAGVLGLPFPERLGGSGQPYEVYLQALEEIARVWMSVGIGVSVHVMSLGPLEDFGTPEQQRALLPPLIAGD
ncbi:MAG TPA: acyl-CoA dehydrogenase family protein, partial [Propionibacteriaceae bacterium]|nr:acyl-CoA dehydrogenase family protein [Propionibacteriaceae bacterium]